VCWLAYVPATPDPSDTATVGALWPANASGGGVYPREVTICQVVAGIDPHDLLQLQVVGHGAIGPVLAWLVDPG